MNRKCSIGAMRRGIDLATNEGINVTLTFVVGFPGECRATLDRTAAFLNGLPQQNKGYSPFELYPFYLPPNSLSDDPAFRKRYALHGRCDAWSHQTMAFGEVVSEWAPYLYRQVDTTPYSYSTNDVLFGWSTRKRAEVFGARKEITKAFLESASDRSIQERFSRLHDLMVTSDRLSVAHRWQDVLGGREMQPGRARPALDDSRPTVRGAHGGEP